MVVSLWSRLWSVITTSNDLNPALPEAPTCAQATCAAQAAPPQILQVGFWPQGCCSALQGVILIYFPNCKLSFFKLQSVFSANSASWDFGRRSALQGTPLISAECALQCTSGGLWRWAAILQVGLLQAAPLTVKRRSPFKALTLTTQPLSLVLMCYQL